MQVLEVELTNQGHFLITVESTLPTTPCRVCGRALRRTHGTHEPIVLRHLPVLGRQTYVRLCPRRFRCVGCPGQPMTTQRLDWYMPKTPNTHSYEQHLLLQLVNTSLQDLSLKEHLGYQELVAVLDRWIARRVDWRTLQRLRQLGLDEIASRKGHRDFVVLVTARGQEIDKVVGLENSADDYVTKPFGLRELLARVRAPLRRLAKQVAESETGRFSDIELNFGKHQAWKGAQPLELSPREFEILKYFIQHRGETVTRDQLPDEV